MTNSLFLPGPCPDKPKIAISGFKVNTFSALTLSALVLPIKGILSISGNLAL